MFDRANCHLPLTRCWELGLMFMACLLVLLTVSIHPVRGFATDKGIAGQSSATSDPNEPLALDAPRTTDALGDPLPEGSRLRMGTQRFHHPSVASELALSPDEKSVVTIGKGKLIVWDAADGKEKWRANLRETGFHTTAASYGIRGIAFSGDSSKFYTPGKIDEFNVWNIDTGKRQTFKVKRLLGFLPSGGMISQARSIDVTQDGKKIALGSSKGLTVCNANAKKLFEIKNQPKVRKFEPLGRDRLKFGGDYTYGRFAPDGNTLAMVTYEAPKEIRIVDVHAEKEVRRIHLTDKLVRFDFSADGKQIAATERDNAVRLYDIQTGDMVWSHIVVLTNRMENYTSAIDVSPDGNTIAVAATDHRLYLMERKSGTEIARLEGHQWYPWAVQFTADSQTLFSSGWDGVVRRWDVASGKQIELPKAIRANGVVTASPNGKRIAYADDLETIHIIDASNGKEIRKLENSGIQFSQLAFSPDSFYLAGGGNAADEVRVTIWNTSTGEVNQVINWPHGGDRYSYVEELEFSRDGKRLAVATFRQSMAFLFDAVSGRKVAELPHREIYGLSFSPDNTTLATAGWDSIIRFWNAEDGSLRSEFSVKKNAGADPDLRMYTIRYSPNGDRIATAHMNSQVRVWDAEDMTLQASIGVDGLFRYGTMSFSPDGLWLATGINGRDAVNAGEVTLWDPRTGQKVWDTGRHQGYVYTVGFGRDSRTLLSGGRDGCCYLWDLSTGNDLTTTDAEVLWTGLQSEDSKIVFRAMTGLSRSPKNTISMLTKKLTEKAFVGTGDVKKRQRMAHLVTSLLAQIRTADAIRLLKQMSRQTSDMPLKNAAANTLNRIRSS